MKLTRRTMLRGFGAAVSLPLLDAMRPLTALAASSAASSAPPVRMAFLFVPNGVHMADWRPTSQGFGFRLPYILEPLSKVQDQLLVLSGLTHDRGRANGDGPGDHARSASVFLTGAQPRKTSGSNIRSGMSVDQAAARVIGRQTRFSSLELGCEEGRGAGNCDSGYSCAYSSNISWASENSPMGKEINPRAVFERLFAHPGSAEQAAEGRGLREAFRKSILDFVADDARRLRDRLGKTDGQKVDEYLHGVREIEQRIEKAEGGAQLDPAPDGYAPPAGVPKKYAEHLRLMSDMLVLAFQADLTRVSTFMLANAGSNRSYRDIDVPEGHHDLSHHGGDPRKHLKIRDINRFHTTQLAYLLDRLKSIPEGEGTLLDNCMIAYGSGLSDGNAHNHDDLPLLLAGGGGGTLTPGRHVVYDVETPMTNLFLSMLDRVGAGYDFLGDSTGRLPGLQI